MSEPLVSVLVTFRDPGATLEETLDGIAAQSINAWELLVADVGSMDAATVSRLQTSRPTTSVVRVTDPRVGRARNVLLERSRGAYLCAVDAGARLDARYLERALALLENDGTVAFACCHAELQGDPARSWRPSSCSLEALIRE